MAGKKARTRRKSTSSEKNTAITVETDPETSEDGGLLKCLLKKVSHEALIDDWLNDYDNCMEYATGQLLTFFLDVTGYQGSIKSEVLINDYAHDQVREKQRVEKMVQRIAVDYIESSVDPPIYVKGTRNEVACFIQRLIQKGGASVLCDGSTMDRVNTLLFQMLRSHVRPIRYVATFMMVKIISATLNVYLDVKKARAYADKQRSADQSRSSHMKTTEHTEVLENKAIEYAENEDELQDMIFGYLLPSSFPERYRDVCPEIVTFCMGELGTWMELCPDVFQQKSYFDTYNVMLYHPAPAVRRTCLMAMRQLFSSRNATDKLWLFMRTVRSRLILLTKDKVLDIASLALNVLATMMKLCGRSVLDSDKKKKKKKMNMSDSEEAANNLILQMVFSKHMPIAYEAGKLLGVWLLCKPVDGSRSPDSNSNSSSSSIDNSELFVQIVEFFAHCQLPDHAVFLIDALKGFHPVLTDWETMTDVLLKHELDDSEETNVIKIMRSCVQVGCHAMPPVGRDKKFKKTTAIINKSTAKRAKMTHHFIPLMPRLLVQYRADPEKVIELLRILQYFDLSQYTTPRQGQDLIGVVKTFEDIIEIHNTNDILKLCCTFLSKVSREEVNTAINKCIEIWRNVETNHFLEIQEVNERVFGAWHQEEPVDGDDLRKVEVHLNKMTVFHNYSNLGFLDLWEQVFPYVAEAKNIPLPLLVVHHATNICEQTLLWGMLTLCEKEQEQELEQLEDDSSFATEDQAKMLHDRLEQLLSALLPLLTKNKKTSKKIFTTICMLIHAFYYGIPDNPALKPMWYEASTEVNEVLESFAVAQFFRNGTGAPRDPKNSIEPLRLYCELIVDGKLNDHAAVMIIRYYHETYEPYFDIIKWMLEQILDRRKNSAARLMSQALKMSYQELQNANETIQEADLALITETADNFGKILSKSRHINSDGIKYIHSEGILFALNNNGSNAVFLVVLLQLVSLVLPQDCLYLVHLVEQRSKDMPQAEQVCGPVGRYREQLMERHKRTSRTRSTTVASSSAASQPPGRKRGRGDTSTPAERPLPKKLNKPNKPKLDVIVKRTRPTREKGKSVSTSSEEGMTNWNVSEIRASPEPGTSKGS